MIMRGITIGNPRGEVGGGILPLPTSPNGNNDVKSVSI